MSKPNKKPRLLMIGQLPPPIHGPSMINELIVSSEKIKTEIDIIVIPIRMTKTVGAIGKLQLRKIVASASIYFKLIRALIRRDIDAVYLTASVNGFAMFRDLGIVLICRFFSVRRVLHIHMLGLRQRYIASSIARFAYKLMFDQAAIVHLSERLYADVSCVTPPSLFFTISNGLPDPQLRVPMSGHQRKSAKEGRPTVLFLSNLLLEKGPLDAIEASRRLLLGGLDHQLLIVGAEHDPVVSDAVRAAAAGDVGGGAIQYLGGLYGDRKFEVMRDADILVFPSWTECQPLAILEAMAMELAIVASNVGGIPDLIESNVNGLLFEKQDVDQLVKCLGSLIADKEKRQRLGEAARERYVAEYTISRFEDRFIKIVGGLISKAS